MKPYVSSILPESLQKPLNRSFICALSLHHIKNAIANVMMFSAWFWLIVRPYPSFQGHLTLLSTF